MAETYNVVLVALGNRKKQILEYIKNSSNYGYEEANLLLEKLPVVIRKTSNRFEARIIKEALQSLGAEVEIQKEGTPSGQYSSRQRTSSNQSVNQPIQNTDTNYSSPIASNDLQNRGGTYSQYNLNLEPVSPIKDSKGCALIIVVGFLIFFSVSVCFSYLVL